MSLPPIDLAVFHDNGYTRQQCRITDLWFWTCDPQRTTCGDTHEDEYSFIGKPLIEGFEQRGRALKDAMREAFLSFLKTINIIGLNPTLFLHDGAMIFTSPSHRSQTSNLT